MSGKKIGAFAAVGLVVAGLGYMTLTGQTKTPDSGTAPAATLPAVGADTKPAITVVAVEKSVLRDTVRASGLVGAVERIVIQPQIEGQAIESINAEVGDHVAAGAVLAHLSESSLKLQKTQIEASRASAEALIAQSEAQLIDAKATADEANRALQRANSLHQQGNASQAATDLAATSATSANARVQVATQGAAAARAQLAMAEAQISNIDLQLARTQVTAPNAGEIVERHAMAGAIASAAGQPMFVLVRDGLLELSADVAEQDLPRISAGQWVSLRVAGSDVPLTGTVRLVEPAIDIVTRLGRVRVAIDQADRIRTGMFLEAEIAISEREVLAVPITALGNDENGSFVMTVDKDGKIHRSAVVTGVRDGAEVEIQTGVMQGDLVVAKAASFVRDGDIVNPIPAKAVVVTN